jgi:hypothetical protein
MGAPFNTGLRIAFILTVLFSSIVASGQATQTVSNSDALAVSLKMQTASSSRSNAVRHLDRLQHQRSSGDFQ